MFSICTILIAQHTVPTSRWGSGGIMLCPIGDTHFAPQVSCYKQMFLGCIWVDKIVQIMVIIMEKSTETFQLLARHSLVPYYTLDGMGYNVSQAFIQCIVECMNWVDVSVWAQFIFRKKNVLNLYRLLRYQTYI